MPDKNAHILNASSNLLGFCFFVLVSIKALRGVIAFEVLDEIVALSILFFSISCFLSFLSIRSVSLRSAQFEKYAEYLFIGGLCMVVLISLILLFDFVQLS
jgi:hypothetical protein